MRKLVFCTLLILVVSLFGQGTAPGDIDSDGRLEVANKQHLLYLSENSNADWTADYEQVNDIVFTTSDFESGGDFYNDGKGFSPIGPTSNNAFSGTYNGQNYDIDGLYIDRENEDYIGL